MLCCTAVVIPSSCAWTTATVTYPLNRAITPNTLTCSAGSPVTTCTDTSSIVAGTGLTLTLTAGTCVLAGTPTSAVSSVAYTVTATNTGGSATAAVTVTTAGKITLSA